MENTRHQSHEPWRSIVRLGARAWLLVLWGIGIRAAILNGFHPVKGPFFHYATVNVIVNCALMTLQAVLVYAVLRPATLIDDIRRFFAAFLLVCYIFAIDYYTLLTSSRDYVSPTMMFVSFNVLATAVASLAVIVGFFLKLILKRRSSKHLVVGITPAGSQ